MQTLNVLAQTMQKAIQKATRKAQRTHTRRIFTTSIIVLICAGTLPLLNACGTSQNIHIQHPAQASMPQDVCAQAYLSAQHSQRIITPNEVSKSDDNHKAKRSQNNAQSNIKPTTNKTVTTDTEWKQSIKNWETVAQQCPGRLSEAIVRRAKNQWLLISGQSGAQGAEAVADPTAYAQQTELEAYAQLRNVLESYEHIQWSREPLVQVAKAENQIAFILQTLAAKKINGVTLKDSDMAASNSQGFIHAAGVGADEDLRNNAYDIPPQALASGKARDNASNIDLPIAAIAYMDCARAELKSFEGNADISTTKRKNDSQYDTDTNAGEGRLASGADGHYSDTQVRAAQALKDAIIKLITSRLLRAYSLGYPADEKLVLK
ncbi:hypothetical protein [Gardnerella sp. KA00747]|uniref:hypothetical protein n=1 Tax=Gardnerella sp. KA00747 TaxID=2749078 RepID=UPI003BA90757